MRGEVVIYLFNYFHIFHRMKALQNSGFKRLSKFDKSSLKISKFKTFLTETAKKLQLKSRSLREHHCMSISNGSYISNPEEINVHNPLS